MTEPAGPTHVDRPDLEAAAAASIGRAAAIEFAAAVLIVGGILGFAGAVAAAGSLPAGAELLLAATLALNIGSVVAGLLVRFGRLWILAVNYVAVLGFLDIIAAGGSGLALVLGILDIVVVVILFLQKPWFDAKREERRAAARGVAARRPTRPAGS